MERREPKPGPARLRRCGAPRTDAAPSRNVLTLEKGPIVAASNIRHRMPRPRHRELRGTNYTIFEHRRTERPGRRARADPRGDSEPNPIARTIPITKVAVAGGDGAVRARSPVYPHVRQLTYEPYNARGRGVTDGVLLLEPISANRTRMALIS